MSVKFVSIVGANSSRFGFSLSFQHYVCLLYLNTPNKIEALQVYWATAKYTRREFDMREKKIYSNVRIERLYKIGVNFIGTTKNNALITISTEAIINFIDWKKHRNCRTSVWELKYRAQEPRIYLQFDVFPCCFCCLWMNVQENSQEIGSQR